MDVFDLAAKITLDDSGYVSGLEKAKKAFGTAAKVIGVGVTAAAGAVVALTKQAVGSYSEYEQLVGGVETLFGAGGKSLEEYAESVGKTVDEVRGEYSGLMAAQDEVMQNASEAYKTAGMSMNEYMDTVTSISASLIQSVGGDTVKAAQLADQAIIDMSDNANKMGSDIASIQAAYQGFAKQNYTMLDNLKLGYGGTKTEMERLLEDADALSDSFKLQKDAAGNLVYEYDDIVEAIHIVQTEMGITGTTAKEADKTIQGSLSATKAAWSNLVTAFADPKADLGKMIGNFVDSGKKALGNLIPTITQAFSGIGQAVQEIAPIIAEELPALIETLLPSLLDAAGTLVVALVENLPMIISILIQQIPTIVSKIWEALKTAWQNIDWGALKDLGISILEKIGLGVLGAMAKVVEWGVKLVQWLGDGLGSMWEKIKEFGSNIITKIGEGLASLWGTVSGWAGELFDKLVDGAGNAWSKIVGFGKNIVNSIWDGIKSVWDSLKNWLAEKIEHLPGGKWVADKLGLSADAMANGMDYVPGNNYPAILHRGEAVLTREEADDWRAGKSGSQSNMTVNIYTQEVSQSTVDYIIGRANLELGGQLA